MGTQLPLKRGTAPAPTFRRMSCGQTAGWIKIPLGREVVRGPGYIVLDGDSAPPPQRSAVLPQFSAHVSVCCGQTAGWIKMALGREVALGPGHIVLDGVPAPLP